MKFVSVSTLFLMAVSIFLSSCASILTAKYQKVALNTFPSDTVLGVVTSKVLGFGTEGLAFGIPADEIFECLKISYH